MQIGVVLPQFQSPRSGETPSWATVRSMAVRAEELGFDTVWVADELLWAFDEWPGPRGWWEGVAMAGAVAASTSRIEVGTWVLSALHRNPGLTAKVVATLDEISGGRFLFGFGSGHAGKQGEKFGYPLDHTIGRYEEALQIIVPLLREGRVDFAGEYHRAVNLEQLPPGPRPGRIPIMLGAHQPRTLRLAVQHADIWSDFARESSLPDAFQPVIAQLDAICDELGRDRASLGRSIGVIVEALDQHDAEDAGLGVPIAGSAEEIAATMRVFADMGVTRIELMLWPNTPASLEAVAPVLQLLDESAAVQATGSKRK
jgi:alkanesulfonate monooxygenase SsuD/methylene tetrahydromethanopterin reductase-like flavin-dependent oxidoreductase (luciferase family)